MAERLELGDDKRPEDPGKTSSGMLGPPGRVAIATLCNWGALGVQELHLLANLHGECPCPCPSGEPPGSSKTPENKLRPIVFGVPASGV